MNLLNLEPSKLIRTNCESCGRFMYYADSLESPDPDKVFQCNRCLKQKIERLEKMKASSETSHTCEFCQTEQSMLERKKLKEEGKIT